MCQRPAFVEFEVESGLEEVVIRKMSHHEGASYWTWAGERAAAAMS